MRLLKLRELKRLVERLPVMSRHVDSLVANWPNVPPLWDRFDHYETAVTLVIQDILRPGDTFYDCGANLGGISLSGSRAVGPYGKVVAFEVSPRIIPMMISNLRAWYANNVHIMPNAVWSTSGEQIPLYLGGAHFADSVVHKDGKEKPDLLVETIALDDVVEAFGVPPRLVKFDIEGAEQEALKGFTRTIEQSGPVCILEMAKSDETLTNWMVSAGYTMFDCNDYQKFIPDTSRHGLCNVLCVHEKDQELLEQLLSLTSIQVFECDQNHWKEGAEGPFLQIPDMEAGRYLLEYFPTDTAKANATFVQIELLRGEPGPPLTAHGSHLSHLCQSYTVMPFHLRRTQDLIMRIQGLTRQEVADNIPSVKISKVETKGDMKAPWEMMRIRL